MVTSCQDRVSSSQRHPVQPYSTTTPMSLSPGSPVAHYTSRPEELAEITAP
jgi:hypothetical protein